MAKQIISEIRSSFRSLFGGMTRTFEAICEPHGTNPTRIAFLALIAEQDATRSADLIRVFQLAPRTVTEAIDGLEGEGLIERRPDPSDRRAKILHLTKAGAALLESVAPERDGFVERMLETLTPEEAAQFASLLSRVSQRLLEIEGDYVSS